jgi:putative transposase
MRVPANVETSRRDVSNHAANRKGMAHSPHKMVFLEGHVIRNNGTSERDRVAIETPHRGVSTPDDAALYKNRYRVQSTRLPGWDYAANAYYFVTICTRDRATTLGHIEDGHVILSPAGEIANDEWRKTSDVRPDVRVDAYVMMPNHVHGILIIDRNRALRPGQPSVETPRRGVSTSRLAPGSLGAIIGQFKSICTKRIRYAGMSAFGWQPRFYDHIIRDEDTFDRIRQYIIDNPLKWNWMTKPRKTSGCRGDNT